LGVVVIYVKSLVNNISKLLILLYPTKVVVSNYVLLLELVVETCKVYLCLKVILLNINFYSRRAIAVTNKVFVGMYFLERLCKENASYWFRLQITLVLLLSVEDSEYSPQYILTSCAS
jgi:hypothetical protein